MAKTKTLSPIKLKIRIPHVILDVRNADQKLVEDMIPGLEEIDARIKIIGNGAKSLPHAFSAEEAIEEAHIWVILGSEMPSEFKEIIKAGIVPIMLTGTCTKAENYDATQEKGNAFLFPKSSAWHIYGTLVRALENFRFSYDWENIRSQGHELI